MVEVFGLELRASVHIDCHFSKDRDCLDATRHWVDKLLFVDIGLFYLPSLVPSVVEGQVEF